MTRRSSDRITRRQTLAALLAAGMAPAIARGAKAAGRDFAIFNAVYAKQIVLPAFDVLMKASSIYAQTVAAFAATPDASGLDLVREGYNQVADAWAGSQQFHIGPLAQEQRSERFAYWPERRNIVEKQLHALLAGHGNEGLAVEHFTKGSVAVQGLPALERIIYGEDGGQNLLQGKDAARRRAIIVAIAENLKSIAAEAHGIWGANLQDPARSGLSFAANAAEGTAQSYTNLLTIMQVVAEQKIGAPLGGADTSSANPKAAEQWRSGRSMQNVRINLRVASASVLDKAGFASLLDDTRADLRAALEKGFNEALAAAAAVGADLPAAVSHPDKRKRVTALLVRVNHLRDLLRQQVPSAIGITLGFNELDGDGS